MGNTHIGDAINLDIVGIHAEVVTYYLWAGWPSSGGRG
jgi:hypothetical protein